MSVGLHHRLDGPADAPLLALSNSLGTSITMWDHHVPALANQLRIDGARVVILEEGRHLALVEQPEESARAVLAHLTAAAAA